jgi:peptide/nickel transport system permease protein
MTVDLDLSDAARSSAASDGPLDVVAPTPNLSPSRRAWRRFRRNRLAMAGLVLLTIFVIASVGAPWLATHDPAAIDLGAVLQGPSRDHLLGTDQAGRDVFSRLLYGGRVSLTIGFTAAASTILVGASLGLLAGYRGGAVDWVIMRMVEVVLSFPSLVLIIFFVTLLGRDLSSIVLVMVLFQWPTSCRLVRNMTVSIKEWEFVQAARGFGAGGFRVTLRHILPGVIGPLCVSGTLLAATAILLESSLSFLGFGIAPPTATWGSILNEAQSLTVLESMPWLWIPAGGLIALTVLSINFAGDGLRDALDPRSTQLSK